MPRRTAHIPFALLGLALAAPLASAQPPNWRTLQPVDPNVGDLNPLSASSRFLPTDLRQPTNFEKVFRVPGSSRGVGPLAPSGPNDRFARVSGAITAVFPRSEYIATKKGILPAIPVNTIFYIGDSPLFAAPPRDSPHELSANAAPTGISLQLPTFLSGPSSAAAQPVDLRVRAFVDPAFGEITRPLRPDAPIPAANIFSDEQFRRARVRALLMSAIAHPQ